MSVDLTGIPLSLAEPIPLDFGNVSEPATGGRRTRIDRMGTRWAWRFETPAMRLEPDGRLWAEKLHRARRLGAIMPLQQPDLNVSAPGLPKVRTATPTGRIVPLKGLTPHYAIKAGYWLSLVVDGQRYLDQVAGQVIADASGNADVELQNLIRTPLSVDDVAEIGIPKIEGALEGLSGGAWVNDRITSFSFTITEEG